MDSVRCDRCEGPLVSPFTRVPKDGISFNRWRVTARCTGQSCSLCATKQQPLPPKATGEWNGDLRRKKRM